MVRPEKVRLGDMLVQEGSLTPASLKNALAEQQRTGLKLGRVLIKSGYVTALQISEVLAHQMQIPFVDISQCDIDPNLVRKMPESLARYYHAIVLQDRGSTYLVGMTDPTDLSAYDEISRKLGREIDLAVVSEEPLLNVIDASYSHTEEISNLAQELGHELEQEDELYLGKNATEFARISSLAPSAEDAPVVKLLQTIFNDAVQAKASDIHIVPQETQLKIRFRIDGVLHLQTEVDMRIASALALRLKLTAGLDITEKRLPQDGRFSIRVRKVSVRRQYQRGQLYQPLFTVQ